MGFTGDMSHTRIALVPKILAICAEIGGVCNWIRAFLYSYYITEVRTWYGALQRNQSANFGYCGTLLRFNLVITN